MSEATERFSLRLWAWLAWLPCAAMTAAASRRHGVAYAAGAVLGSLVLPLAISWLAWKLRGYSKTRSSVVFTAIVLLATFARLAQIGRTVETRNEERHTQEVLADLGKETAGLREQFAAEVESGELGTAANIERAASVIDKAARRLGGHLGEMSSAVAGAYRELVPAAQEYDAAWHAVGAGGGIDASTIDSREAIATRVVLARRGVEATEAFRKVLAAFPATANARVLAVDAPEREKRDFARGMSAGIDQFLNGLKTIEYDAEGGRLMIEILTLLDREWGRWSFDSGTDLINFENEAAIEEYNQTKERLDTVIAAQQRVVRESLAAGAGTPAPAAP